MQGKARIGQHRITQHDDAVHARLQSGQGPFKPGLVAVAQGVLGRAHAGRCTTHEDAAVDRGLRDRLGEVLFDVCDCWRDPVFVASKIKLDSVGFGWGCVVLVAPQPYLLELRRPLAAFHQDEIVTPADLGQELGQRRIGTAVDAGQALLRAFQHDVGPGLVQSVGVFAGLVEHQTMHVVLEDGHA